MFGIVDDHDVGHFFFFFLWHLAFYASQDLLRSGMVAQSDSLYSQLKGGRDTPNGICMAVESAFKKDGTLVESDRGILFCVPKLQILKCIGMNERIHLLQHGTVAKNALREIGTIERSVGQICFHAKCFGECSAKYGMMVHQLFGAQVAIIDRPSHCAQTSAHNRLSGTNASGDSDEFGEHRGLIEERKRTHFIVSVLGSWESESQERIFGSINPEGAGMVSL